LMNIHLRLVQSGTPVMLNLGYGGGHHQGWTHTDFQPTEPEVTSHHLCLDIPAPEETFDNEL